MYVDVERKQETTGYTEAYIVSTLGSGVSTKGLDKSSLANHQTASQWMLQRTLHHAHHKPGVRGRSCLRFTTVALHGGCIPSFKTPKSIDAELLALKKSGNGRGPHGDNHDYGITASLPRNKPSPAEGKTTGRGRRQYLLYFGNEHPAPCPPASFGVLRARKIVG